jgi:hypothetical protein
VPESAGITLTPEQLQTLLAGAIKAAHAPDPEEQEKKDKEKARAAASRQASHDIMMADYQAKIDRQKNCSHKKENGKWATGGQVIKEKIFLICQHCQKEWTWKPDPSVITQLLAGDLTLHQAEPPNQNRN